ncbi:endoglucanase-like protein [Oleiharenicola lentus]|uniref:Endoglucanase-like protein n=1 Tax=Oleiharenicola lentus TaxID=2508720 RepID=A0A4Q1C4S8_9BACT|nr:glycoside hydrolase family 9 protein [Oleiharenicola lentus]RXK53412.1 endoglucanase-like protein [Oleiharenicola lentus]
MKILFNHIGYAPDDAKVLLIDAPEKTSWRELALVSLPDGATVWRGAATFAGGVAGWSVGPWWRADVSAVRAPGRYALRWATADATGQSEGFEIAESLFGQALVSDLLFYFKGQRCAGIYDRADRRAKRVGDGAVRDVRGGWFDASGDTSKYLSHLSYANFMNPQQTPLVVWVLARAWHLCRAAGAPPYFLERIQAEALHGADWLVRMQDPAGFWHVTVFDRWSKDPAARELCSYRTQKGDKYDDYQAGWRQGGGMAAAALALASTLGDGDEFRRADYFAAAQKGFAHLQQHGLGYLDDGQENIIDDTCALLAAVELQAVAPGASVAAELEKRLASLVARRRATDGTVWLAADGAGERSWFHASDAGLPLVALLRLADALPGHAQAGAARDVAKELVCAQLALGQEYNNPFGYPPHWVKTAGVAGRVQWFYPHENPSGYWWQGENARLASLAAAAQALGAATRDPAPAAAARRWTDWVLGANPFDRCMLQGRGRNNPVYSPPYDNAPGGVCNGITSGFTDERDIAFAPTPQATDPAQNWRWGEQWLPHGAWLLYALALRETGGRS